MALIKGSVNPLNVVGQRRLQYIPPHFSILNIENPESGVEKIDRWIYDNLNSRYCIKLKQGLDAKRRIVEVCQIGVEDPKELTLFSLACPYVYNKN